MQEFLRATDIVDAEHPAIVARARQLRSGATDPVVIAKRSFEWVRDEIAHTMDARLDVVTCRASDVLAQGTGYCYAKSHLLAALLRANGIPAGFCYQRFAEDEASASFILHGLNAVWLEGYGWYRIDARGNRADVDAQFAPPVEQLAFPVTRADIGEIDSREIWSDPLPVVITALRSYHHATELDRHLPDARWLVHGSDATPRVTAAKPSSWG